MKNDRKVFAFLCILALAAAGAAFAAQSSRALDGARFTVEVGAGSPDRAWKDELIFDAGQFRSTACDEYGFTVAPYATSAKGKAVTFEVRADSKTEGVSLWQGEVKGDTIHGTLTWTRPGQEAMEYRFSGHVAK